MADGGHCVCCDRFGGQHDFRFSCKRASGGGRGKGKERRKIQYERGSRSSLFQQVLSDDLRDLYFTADLFRDA